MKLQTLQQKKGEIAFRSLITEQHTGNRLYFKDELNSVEMLRELHKRVLNTRRDFHNLHQKGVNFSKYLEIGAEYCSRACVIENELDGRGYALDIAQAPLQKARWFASKFNFTRLPTRILGDAYHLPFKKNSFTFVFCYQTLHHFPDPLPIIKEIHRVLVPGGFFFCGDEPIRQEINLRLFRRPTKLGRLQLVKYLFGLPFISDIGKTEVDHGILETSFSLTQWQQTLVPFTYITATVTPFLWNRNTESKKLSQETIFIYPSLLNNLFIKLLGGGITILAQKEATKVKNSLNNSYKVDLYCPTCHSKLFKKSGEYFCTKCMQFYKSHREIINLLPKQLSKKLYAAN